MKITVFVKILVPCLYLAFPVGGHTQQRHAVPINQIHAEDGDTIILSIKKTEYRIQLRGIDAPEDSENPKLKVDVTRTGLDQNVLLEMGKRSTGHIKSLIRQGSTLALDFNPEKKDRYGRTPGDLINSDGKTLSELMVKHGFAIVNRRTKNQILLNHLKSIQRQAMADKRGLWAHDIQATRAWAGINSAE